MDTELNSNIINSKCMLFLGAGASAPLGLEPTVPFLNTLPDKLQSRIKKKTGEKIDGKDFNEGLKSLFTDSAKHYRVKMADSEVVLDYVDHLCKTCDRLYNLPPVFHEVAGTGGSRDFQKRWFDMFTRIRDGMREVIVDHYSKVDGNRAWEVYGRLLDTLCGPGRLLPIFTTNYDWVFESIRADQHDKVRVVDGFGMDTGLGGFWDKTVFKNFDPAKNRMNLALFKLHGSTSWYREGPPLDRIRKFPRSAPELAGLPAVLIYPTQVKAEAVNEDPFKTAYDYLRETLLHTNLCIVIGSSFRDPAINEVFHAALTNNVELKLVVVEPTVGDALGMPLDELLGRLKIKKSDWGRKLNIIKKRFGDDEAVYEEIARRAQMHGGWYTFNKLVSD